MYENEKEEFGKLIADLCTSVNRPFSADLVRVLWEDLKQIPFPQIDRQVKAIRASGKKTFNSNDLRPPPEERMQLGGPDNEQLLAKLDRAFERLWDQLSPNQRALGSFKEYIWTRDRLAPRPVALLIKADTIDLGDREIHYPGHRINIIDCDLDTFGPAPTQPDNRLPPGDDEFNEADAARALLNRAGTPDLLQS